MATRRESWVGMLLILPALILITGLLVFPVISTIHSSFYNKHLLRTDQTYVGTKNYQELVTRSEWAVSGRNTLVWTIGTVILINTGGLGAALILNKKLLGRGLARGLLLIPWVTPMVVTGLVWRWLTNELYGVINWFLLNFHLVSQPISFYGDAKLAMPSAIVTYAWRTFPFAAVVILAGLQTVPPEQYEAARVDGASTWQEFRFVTIPGLRHVLFVSTLLTTIWALNHFDLIWILTQGGPGTSTQTLSILSYVQFMSVMDVGRGAAVATTLAALISVIAVVYFRVAYREGED